MEIWLKEFDGERAHMMLCLDVLQTKELEDGCWKLEDGVSICPITFN